ncbi:MAG: gamma-glutamyl-gamma-aminobutyrate hydrolase family protein [Planctomycetota bacterium]|nr:gamma-glutamyl-gamma-aminobutyrate hydrolase family protein [Planctomycetota bacterium]
MTPLIGIEVDLEATASGRRYAKCYETYVDAVSAAGGAPVLVPPMPDAALSRALDALDGLVVPGGDDLAAEEWGEVQRPCPRFVAVDARRLAAGKRLVTLALERNLPLLGVCYGAQLLNLVLGGTMIQDIPDERPAALDHRAGNHEVSVAPGSLLARLLGPGLVVVNSRHHQTNREPGRGLVVSAVAPDGIVEAVESPDPERFVLGVQWHPEDQAATGGPLFAGLVEAARRRH